jgi:signal transduction histidine kinase
MTILPFVLAAVAILFIMLFIVLFILIYNRRILQHKAMIRESENAFQRQLITSINEITELERKRIVSNIHDDVGMLLNVLIMNIAKIDKNVLNEKLVRELLSDSKKILQQSINSIRAISYDLMPPTLLKFGFIEGLKEICNQMNEMQIIKININSTLAELIIDKSRELQLYRLVKEIINNILKHENEASEINILIHQDQNKLIIIISHNGKGINNKSIKELLKSSKGIGLKSIFSRVHIMNSKIDYLNDKKAQVIIQTPIK